MTAAQLPPSVFPVNIPVPIQISLMSFAVLGSSEGRGDPRFTARLSTAYEVNESDACMFAFVPLPDTSPIIATL